MRLHFSRILSVQVWRKVRERTLKFINKKNSLIEMFKFSGSCPGSSCHRTGSESSGGRNNCKDLLRQIKQLTSENTKLNKKVEQLSEKSSDSAYLRKENKKLTSEVSRFQKQSEELLKIFKT